MVKRLQMKVGVANTGSDDHCRPKQTCGIDVLCNFCQNSTPICSYNAELNACKIRSTRAHHMLLGVVRTGSPYNCRPK